MMKIVVPGELADLNKYIKAINSHHIVGNRLKQEQTDIVASSCYGQKKVTLYPVKIIFSWYSKDQRKDIDNVAFAKKFVLDGMVRAGILENDGRKRVAGFEDRFYIDKKNPRTEIEI